MNQYWTGSKEKIPIFIHNETDSFSPLPAESPGPFAPVWQMSPPPTLDVSVVNYDLFSNSVFQPLYQQVVDNAAPAWSDFCNTTALFGTSAPNSSGGGPQSILLLPVVSADSPRGVPAVLTSAWDWQAYLQGVLPPDVDGVIVVLADPYSRTATFQVDGLNATFVGTGELFDRAYAEMVYTAQITCDRPLSPAFAQLSRILQGQMNGPTFIGAEDQPPSSCGYTMYIYPSETFEVAYTGGNAPALYCTIVVLIVVGTTLAFLLFDCYTRRKEDAILARAERAHAIIASLFPEAVQDRLLGMADESQSRPANRTLGLAGKAGLKTYLRDSDGLRVESLDLDTKPIADLWPDTTVCFCDCVGFTAWSSTREPAQIFLLLETIFSAFDEIAKEHGVFKVSVPLTTWHRYLRRRELRFSLISH
jgi:hypothetical protein